MRINSLVTGANRGIGLAFVRQLLARGDDVIATCRQPGKATALNTLAGEFPGRLHVLPLDVADQKSRAELVRELPLVLGKATDPTRSRIGVLINNAGVLHAGERFGHIERQRCQRGHRGFRAGPAEDHRCREPGGIRPVPRLAWPAAAVVTRCST